MSATLPAVYADLSPRQRKAVRLQYVEEQDGKCQFCGEPLDGPPHRRVKSADITTALFPPGFFRHPVHLHHDHDSGLTIGAVHARCNAYAFEYYDQ